MTKRVLIVGCGQLGSRHLQSLVKVPQSFTVDLLDPAEASLQRSLNLFVGSGGNAEQLKLHQNTTSIEGQSFDLIIVATNSDVRPALVKELRRKAVQSPYWVLEKVLAQSSTLGEEIVHDLSDVKAWVNCPRDYYTCYSEIKSQLAANEPVHITIEGTNWGLACNTVHYLTLLHDFSNTFPVSFDVSALERKAPPAKRLGFVEFYGTAVGKFTNGSTLTVICREGQEVTREHTIRQGDRSWLVQEFQGRAESDVNGTRESKPIHVPTQSELTHLIARDIFKRGDCRLPTLSTSLAIHRQFLDALVDLYGEIQGVRTSLVPIT